MHIKDHGSRQLSPEEVKKLIQVSLEAKVEAYCPYSKFRVGAALLTHDNCVFTGNINTKLWGQTLMFRMNMDTSLKNFSVCCL